MDSKKIATVFIVFLICACQVYAQIDSLQSTKKYQAVPPQTQMFGAEAFGLSNKTEIRWLGMAGFFINSRGTTLMVDPVLGDFDMPLLIEFPLKTEDVPSLDAMLITHGDNDHFSQPTAISLSKVTKSYHSTKYVDSLMKNLSLPSFGHKIGDSFAIGDVNVKLTPVDHAWQNSIPGSSSRVFKDEDAAGFWIETPDGNIWATGDSRLMPDHLNLPTPDAIFFDFSDSQWHFTLEGAVKIANAYPDTPLLLCHWGSVDSPDFVEFNGNPEDLKDLVKNPERIYVLAPGEPFILKKLSK